MAVTASASSTANEGSASLARTTNSSTAAPSTGSDGTGMARSPATPSGSRLVARTRSWAHAANASVANETTEGSRCSQLSSTRSSSRSPTAPKILSRTESAAPAVIPSAEAINGSTAPASRVAASSTHHTPPLTSARRRAAYASASLVLPTPPGPVSVTSRPSVSSRLSSSSCSPRPTMLVSAAGSFPVGRRVASDVAGTCPSCSSASCSRTSSLPGDMPSSVARMRRARSKLRSASARRLVASSDDINRAHRRSRSGSACTSRSASATTSAPGDSMSAAAQRSSPARFHNSTSLACSIPAGAQSSRSPNGVPRHSDKATSQLASTAASPDEMARSIAASNASTSTTTSAPRRYPPCAVATRSAPAIARIRRTCACSECFADRGICSPHTASAKVSYRNADGRPTANAASSRRSTGRGSITRDPSTTSNSPSTRSSTPEP